MSMSVVRFKKQIACKDVRQMLRQFCTLVLSDNKEVFMKQKINIILKAVNNFWHSLLTFMIPCMVNIFQYISKKCNFTQFIYNWKLLYMFRVVPPPIIRSAYNCIYSIWYLSHRYCWQIPDGVDTVVCTPDDGWRSHPRHVEQFPDINKLCKVASYWIYIGIYLQCTAP